jgi:MarR family transcriptional regulator, organic hydroperoxide resistance regulator
MNPGDLNHLYIQANRMHHRRAHNRFNELGLGEGQPRLLKHLAREDGLSQAELARRCHLEPATVTVTLTRMEKNGLVERRADETDHRITRIFMTEEGQRMHRILEEMHAEMEEETFEGFAPDEREQLAGYFVRMRDNLRRAEGPLPEEEPRP